MNLTTQTRCDSTRSTKFAITAVCHSENLHEYRGTTPQNHSHELCTNQNNQSIDADSQTPLEIIQRSELVSSSQIRARITGHRNQPRSSGLAIKQCRGAVNGGIGF